jgi:hypothetical protein
MKRKYIKSKKKSYKKKGIDFGFKKGENKINKIKNEEISENISNNNDVGQISSDDGSEKDEGLFF